MADPAELISAFEGMVRESENFYDAGDPDAAAAFRERYAAAHDALLAALTPTPSAEPLTETYVQTVPDKCDRILWRGYVHYIPAITHTTSAEDAAVLMAFQAAAIDAYTQHDGPSELDAKREQLRAACLARMAGKVPPGSVVVPKWILETLFSGYCRHEPALIKFAVLVAPNVLPESFEMERAIKAWEAVSDLLAAAPESPR